MVTRITPEFPRPPFRTSSRTALCLFIGVILRHDRRRGTKQHRSQLYAYMPQLCPYEQVATEGCVVLDWYKDANFIKAYEGTLKYKTAKKHAIESGDGARTHCLSCASVGCTLFPIRPSFNGRPRRSPLYSSRSQHREHSPIQLPSYSEQSTSNPKTSGCFSSAFSSLCFDWNAGNFSCISVIFSSIR